MFKTFSNLTSWFFKVCYNIFRSFHYLKVSSSWNFKIQLKHVPSETIKPIFGKCNFHMNFNSFPGESFSLLLKFSSNHFCFTLHWKHLDCASFKNLIKFFFSFLFNSNLMQWKEGWKLLSGYEKGLFEKHVESLILFAEKRWQLAQIQEKIVYVSTCFFLLTKSEKKHFLKLANWFPSFAKTLTEKGRNSMT